MSTIARKLCKDIVEPVLKPPSTISRTLNCSKKSDNTFSNTKNNVTGRENLQIEKKKYSKTDQSCVNRPTKNNIKFSDKRIKKNLVDSAINTLFSGSLQCDNNSITLIHKREHQITCKCYNSQGNKKRSSKEIQTLSKKNYSISDKSITHCIETVSCGTQFVDNINGILKRTSHRSKSKIALKIQDSNEKKKKRTKITKLPHSNEENVKFNLGKPFTLETPRHLGAKHWAVSNYPTRGPDF